jgi:hypothetical protein
MTFEEAIRLSIKAYMKGKIPQSVNEAKGGLRYTPEYFDDLEKNLLGEKEVDEKDDDKPEIIEDVEL